MPPLIVIVQIVGIGLDGIVQDIMQLKQEVDQEDCVDDRAV